MSTNIIDIDTYLQMRIQLCCTNSKCKFKFYIPEKQSHIMTHYKCPICENLAVGLLTNLEKRNEET